MSNNHPDLIWVLNVVSTETRRITEGFILGFSKNIDPTCPSRRIVNIKIITSSFILKPHFPIVTLDYDSENNICLN